MAISWFEQRAEVQQLSMAAESAANQERGERRSLVQHSREYTSRLKFIALASVAGVVVWSLIRRKRDPEKVSDDSQTRSLVVQAGLAALTIQRWHSWLERFRRLLREEGSEGEARHGAVAEAKD